MDYILETERLRLRKFTTGDTAFIIDLLNSPGWIRYIGDKNVKTIEQAQAYLENGPFRSYRENGFGLSMVEQKDGNLPIGMSGIILRDTLETPDIGFAFLPEYAGKGYGYEIAKAILDHARENYQLEIVSGITLPDNTPSIRLLEKLGLRLVRKFTMPGSEEELLLYRN